VALVVWLRLSASPDYVAIGMTSCSDPDTRHLLSGWHGCRCPAGLVHCAPGDSHGLAVPCRLTFVWIARGHTKRSPLRPLGDCGRGDVRNRVNRIVERVRILLRLMSMRDVFFILEQLAGVCFGACLTFGSQPGSTG
jgi:hypothetical protein